MAKLTFEEARNRGDKLFLDDLFAILVSGQNPDGTDFTLPTSISGLDELIAGLGSGESAEPIAIQGEDISGELGPFLRERVTSAFPVITTDHAFIHEGIAFTAAAELVIASGDTGLVYVEAPMIAGSTAVAQVNPGGQTNPFTGGMVVSTILPGSEWNGSVLVLADPGEDTPVATLAYEPPDEFSPYGLITITLASSGGVITSTSLEVTDLINLDPILGTLFHAENDAGQLPLAPELIEFGFGYDGRYIHFKPALITTSGACVVRLCENPDITDYSADPVTPRNRNRLSDIESLVSAGKAADLTVTGIGTLLDGAVIGSGSGSVKIGGSVESAEEWVLNESGYNYALLIENTAGASNRVIVSLFWYEEVSA